MVENACGDDDGDLRILCAAACVHAVASDVQTVYTDAGG